MKQIIFTFIVSAALLLTGPALRAQTWPQRADMVGNGQSADSAWQIVTVDDLAALAAYVNAGNGPATADKHYRLMNDLDLGPWCAAHEATGGWTPIGIWNDNDNATTTSFRGIFHGNGKVVRNLTINRTESVYEGLFGFIRNWAYIDSLGVENVNITARSYVGGLAGCSYNGSTVKNCYVTGNIEAGGGTAGGLVAYNYSNSKIENCFAIASVIAQTSVGGLVGNNYTSTIQNSYATGSVNGRDYLGGLVGYNGACSIQNCYATGNVSASVYSGYRYIGGLVGGYIGLSIGTPIVIQNCVAANASVSARQKATDMDRIVGKYEGLVAFFNNYALDSMELNNAGMPIAITDNLNGQSGAGKPWAELQSHDFYSTAGNWNTTAPATAWSMVPLAGGDGVWTIWDTKSFPYFPWQSAPVANTTVNFPIVSFELRNAADSVQVYNIRTQTMAVLSPPSGGWGSGIVEVPVPSGWEVQQGDILLFTVFEAGKAPSYPVQVGATQSPPVIRSQPQGGSLCAGDDYTLRVEATGESLSYQWYFNGQAIPGAESDQLLFSNFSPQNEGIYTVKVSNPAYSVTSNNAILRVNSPARIISDLSHAAVCAGSDYTFSPDISGDHLSYQWYFKGQAIPGATGNRLALSDLGPANIGDYHVVVTGACGEPVESRKARLWVGGKLPQPLLFEVPDVAYRGQPTRLHVGYDYGYQDVTDYTWSFGAPNDTVSAGNSHTVYVTFHTVTDSQRVSLRMVHDVCGAYEIYKDIRVESPTGMEELEPETLKLFPSPFRNEVHIRGAEGSLLQIISASGAVVHTQKIENADETILTGHLPEGVYLFRLEKDGKVKTVKGAKI